MGLEAEFTQALERTIEIAKEHKYTPTLFMQMSGEHGGVETAKRLLANKEAQIGLCKLWELNLFTIEYNAPATNHRERSISCFVLTHLSLSKSFYTGRCHNERK